MSLAVKPGVQPRIITILAAISQVARKRNITITITAGIDGKHAINSKHYSLEAVDFRTKDLKDKRGVILDLSTLLGPSYDVILESEGSLNEHGHVEYDPK